MGILINSVSTPLAQTTKLLQAGKSSDKQLDRIVQKLSVNKARLGNYYNLFMIMFLNGTRVSETLSLSHMNINSSGQVYMISSKGSENRLLHCGESTQYMIDCKRKEIDPFFRMNRFQAYRMLKSIDIGILKTGRVHESVTHAFRDMYARRLRNIGLEGKELSKQTGHKNYKNVEHYGKD